MQVTYYEPRTNLDSHRLPAFTLGTALAWSGHECRTCPREAADERADVWLIDLLPEDTPMGLRTLLDVEFVDPAWSSDERANLIRRVNDCTSHDRIQVHERTPAGRLAIAVMESWLSDLDGGAVRVKREMKPTGAGRLTVLDENAIVATEVAFDVAHECVHAGCAQCAAGERHTNQSIQRAAV